MKQPLADKVIKNLPIIKKTILTLEKIHSGEVAAALKSKQGVDQATVVANLVMLLDQISQNHADAHGWAITYGVEKANKKKRQKLSWIRAIPYSMELLCAHV